MVLPAQPFRLEVLKPFASVSVESNEVRVIGLFSLRVDRSEIAGRHRRVALGSNPYLYPFHLRLRGRQYTLEGLLHIAIASFKRCVWSCSGELRAEES